MITAVQVCRYDMRPCITQSSAVIDTDVNVSHKGVLPELIILLYDVSTLRI